MRLIDADELLNTKINIRFTENGKYYVECAEIHKLIAEQPTAYYVDKVKDKLFKELSCYQKYDNPKSDYEVAFEDGCEYAIGKVIEVVEGGWNK